MDMTGERRIAATRERVWAALNDPEILKNAIPGCKSLERVGDDSFRAVAGIKLGPISANFTGEVKLLDLDPPRAYRIEGSGQGGAAGYAKGGAAVSLVTKGDATVLRYKVSAEIGGKLAQLGARLIDATAKQMADQFFDHFTASLASVTMAEHPAAEVPADEAARIAPRFMGLPVALWLAAPIFALILIMMFG